MSTGLIRTLVMLMFMFKEINGKTLCAEFAEFSVDGSGLIPVASMCANSQATGPRVIVDTYTAEGQTKPGTCSCTATVTLDDVASTNINMSPHFDLQPNYASCGSRLVLTRRGEQTDQACFIFGNVDVNNGDKIDISFKMEKNPYATQYCMVLSLGASGNIALTCSDPSGATTGNATTTTVATTTTTTTATATNTNSTQSLAASTMTSSTANISSTSSTSTTTEISTSSLNVTTQRETVFTTQSSTTSKRSSTTSTSSSTVETTASPKTSTTKQTATTAKVSTTSKPTTTTKTTPQPTTTTKTIPQPTTTTKTTPQPTTTTKTIPQPTTTAKTTPQPTTTTKTTSRPTTTIKTTSKPTTTTTKTTPQPTTTVKTTTKPTTTLKATTKPTTTVKTTTETLTTQKVTTSESDVSSETTSTNVPTSDLTSPTLTRVTPSASGQDGKNYKLEVIIPVAVVSGILFILVIICIACVRHLKMREFVINGDLLRRVSEDVNSKSGLQNPPFNGGTFSSVESLDKNGFSMMRENDVVCDTQEVTLDLDEKTYENQDLTYF